MSLGKIKKTCRNFFIKNYNNYNSYVYFAKALEKSDFIC